MTEDMWRTRIEQLYGHVETKIIQLERIPTFGSRTKKHSVIEGQVEVLTEIAAVLLSWIEEDK
jgi:hypothetical protein